MTEGENMLERCARALYELEPRRKAWADLGQHRAYHVKRARAVLEALMDPTPEMLTAAIEPYHYANTEQFEEVFRAAIAGYWQAMLRTILSQPNDEGEGK